MNSQELARYIEAKGAMSQPWMLLMLRLTKLQEERDSLDEATYLAQVAELHKALMGLREWWVGREEELFGG
jgi:hypothetical protein